MTHFSTAMPIWFAECLYKMLPVEWLSPMNLVQLKFSEGSDASAPESLVDLLLACHARIRRFARLAQTVGARPELSVAEVRAATVLCVRYFADALPLHVRDEEDSLWPRLLERNEALSSTIAVMKAQHGAHEAHVEALLSALRAVQKFPGEVALHRQLEQVAARLEADFEVHLRLEETALFPLLGEALSPQEQVQIVQELRARRRPPA